MPPVSPPPCWGSLGRSCFKPGPLSLQLEPFSFPPHPSQPVLEPSRAVSPAWGQLPEGRGPRGHLVPSLPACSFFCPEGASSVLGHDCPAGHYCPASTTFASQFPCPRGTYKPQRGGAQPSDCTPCEPGEGAGSHPHHARPRPGPPRPTSKGRTQAWLRWGVAGPQPPQSTPAGWGWGVPIPPCPPVPGDPVSCLPYRLLLSAAWAGGRVWALQRGVPLHSGSICPEPHRRGHRGPLSSRPLLSPGQPQACSVSGR